MYSQKTIALRRHSKLSTLALLLWFIAATTLVVLLQLPTLFTPLVWIFMLVLLVWRQRQPAIQLKFDEVGAWCVQGEQAQFAQLVYRNDYWLVLKLSNPLEPNWLKRVLWGVVRRHHLVFRDQFAVSDYREARSRLSAAKFMNEPAPKNEF